MYEHTHLLNNLLLNIREDKIISMVFEVYIYLLGSHAEAGMHFA